jgi:hypothetical protein
VLSCTVLIRKYGHWSTELKKTTMDIVSLSKGRLNRTVESCGMVRWPNG